MISGTDQSGKRFGGGPGRILKQDLFLDLVDLEVKRARRYQNFFCILVMRLNQLADHDNGTLQRSCSQKLSHLLAEELRESDILGTLSESCFAALLPYGDCTAGDSTRSRFEGSLKYYDFKNEGYEVKIEQICFPLDGTDTADIVKKVKNL
ncbi:MAG: hypothetical protein H6Q43_1468 [Deltaproteobacteria bacterium]|jgi:hypothetical protein|nr:hypothetical protein [Deltaproteobacteria bacterium]MBP1718030.1 hypothetical protein [Deltaproteobacteria bacterium]